MNKDPRHISISDYTYSLPEEKIAPYPLPERDASRLLIYKDGQITEDTYRHISDHLPANATLVFNDTKVVEARLLFQKPTGGIIEIFCLQPDTQYPDITTAMLQTQKVAWLCLVGGASKWKAGQILEKKIASGKHSLVLQARYIEKKADAFLIELSWTPATLSFAEVLHQAGAIPLPPYIKREADASDSERYQTLYARWEGSVAAPTAGLHFTEPIFKSLEQKNIQTAFVTLHVGAGTFKPVKAPTMQEHSMHEEFIDVSKATIQQLLAASGNPVVAVGTTSLRTLESLYWIGRRARLNQLADTNGIVTVGQWEPYDARLPLPEPAESLQTLLYWMEKNNRQRLIAKTQLLIAPGYTFRMVNGLITNFHQPQSTLLLLVAAMTGPAWKKIYTYALENNFRFLSYGDGCLLWRS